MSYGRKISGLLLQISKCGIRSGSVLLGGWELNVCMWRNVGVVVFCSFSIVIYSGGCIRELSKELCSKKGEWTVNLPFSSERAYAPCQGVS